MLEYVPDFDFCHTIVVPRTHLNSHKCIPPFFIQASRRLASFGYAKIIKKYRVWRILWASMSTRGKLAAAFLKDFFSRRRHCAVARINKLKVHIFSWRFLVPHPRSWVDHQPDRFCLKDLWQPLISSPCSEKQLKKYDRAVMLGDSDLFTSFKQYLVCLSGNSSMYNDMSLKNITSFGAFSKDSSSVR